MAKNSNNEYGESGELFGKSRGDDLNCGQRQSTYKEGGDEYATERKEKHHETPDNLNPDDGSTFSREFGGSRENQMEGIRDLPRTWPTTRPRTRRLAASRTRTRTQLAFARAGDLGRQYASTLQLLFFNLMIITPLHGGASRDRTEDLIVANDALSRLIYSPSASIGWTDS